MGGGTDLIGRPRQGIRSAAYLFDDAGEFFGAGVGVVLDLIEDAFRVACDALREITAGHARKHPAHVVNDAGNFFTGCIGITLELSKGARVVTGDALGQITRRQRAKHAHHI